MPWKDVKPMDEKICFVADFLRGTTSFSQLCLRYGISRKTGYKWTQRYQEGGMEGLDERSRRPKGHPAQTPYAVQQAILELRQRRDPPGPKKIQALLAQRLQTEEIPSLTTIYKILKREGQVEPRRRSRRFGQPPGPLKSGSQANELWSADYKGQFQTADGRWCYPLTIMDHASRYLLACKGLTGTRYPDTKAVFERLFREYGLPERIRTDNGVPFATTGVGNLSRLSIWWIKLGIWPERIEPGQPQQNGRHERMHRTLKRSLTEEIGSTLRAQQRVLDDFRLDYNEHRPHESLAQRSPASCYQASSRPFPRRLPEIEYPSYLARVHVSSNGIAYWRAWRIYVGHLLTGELVGIEQVGEGLWDVYFGPARLGTIDERKADGDYLTLRV